MQCMFKRTELEGFVQREIEISEDVTKSSKMAVKR